MVLRKRKRDGEFVRESTEAGPSSSPTVRGVAPIHEDGPAASPRPRPAKKARKKADPDAPRPEKRGAARKRKCPQNILDRVERVMTQRFYMVDRSRVPGELREEFSVLGSTGNVYTVTISHKPSCNCPDAARGNHCKHILFIFLKVLQVTQASSLWYQKALITSELETIFAEAPLAPNSVAHPRIREAYARATGKTTTPLAGGSKNRRVPGPDDDCPICYDSMHGMVENSLVYCEDCGNALHKECFEQWQLTATNSGKELTCVWCRASWAPAGADGASKRTGGYINLSGVAGTAAVRDTSTYYHGPGTGQRHYGNREYDDY